MWCAHCKAEVAAEVTPDNRRVLCASCGRELVASPSAPPDDKTRQALELLERWSSTRLLEPYGSPATPKRPAPDDPQPPRADVPAPHAPSKTPAAGERRDPLRPAIPESATASSGRETAVEVRHADHDDRAQPAQVRFDAPHPNAALSPRRLRETGPPRAPRAPSDAPGSIGVLEPPRGTGPIAPPPFAGEAASSDNFDHAPPAPIAAQASGGGAVPPSNPVPAADRFDPRPRIHAAHDTVAAPHFDIQAALRARLSERTNWTAVAGQLLAYGGVAVLAIGAALVVFGYFGERDDLAPTGWLVTTAGQMLLFLGIVTLVSGGMEQTSQEVTQRIEVLGEHILRIEHATRTAALRGPRIAPQTYADPHAAPDPAAQPAATRHPGAFDG